MDNSLKKKVISGIIWNGIGFFLNYGLNLIFQIILARLLLPKDFGLIGMISIFISLSMIFIESGFSSALIQKKNPTQLDYSSVFYFNIIIGIALYFILFFTAPYIAYFFLEPKLISILRWFGLTLILSSFIVVHTAIVNKNMNYKLITKINVISSVISGVFGITLAFLDFGVYSLVYKMVLFGAINFVLFILLSKWKPSFIFSSKSIKSLFKFSSNLLLSSIIHSIYLNINNLLIGKFYSSIQLGYYTQGKKLQEIPAIQLSEVVAKVMFPAFSTIQDDNEKIKSIYKRVILSVIWIIFPMVIYLATMSNEIIIIFFTEKWLPAVPYLQILCIGNMLYPIHYISMNLSKSKGFSNVFLKIEIVKKIIGFSAIVIAIPHGVVALVFAEMITSWLVLYFNLSWNGKLINYSFREQIKDYFPTFLLIFFVGTTTYIFKSIFDFLGIYMLFVIGSLLFLFLYFILSYIFKIDGFIYFLNLLKFKKGVK